jgi:hypothetical protein
VTAQLVHDLIQRSYDSERDLDAGRVTGHPLGCVPQSLHAGFDGADKVKEQAEKCDHGNYHDHPDNQRNLPERDFFGGES